MNGQNNDNFKDNDKMVNIRCENENMEYPFVIFVLADLMADNNQYESIDICNREVLYINDDNFNSCIKDLKPIIQLQILGTDDQLIKVELNFSHMDDFRPEAIIKQVPILYDLQILRMKIFDLRNSLNYVLEDFLLEIIHSKETLNRIIEEFQSNNVHENYILNKILSDNPMIQNENEAKRYIECIEAFVNEYFKGSIQIAKDIETILSSYINKTDKIISKQLSKIMHHPSFQKLEATWRGLEYLVSHSDFSSLIEIRVIQVSKNELLYDFEKNIDYEFSSLYALIYHQALRQPGATPYSILIVDDYFNHSAKDIYLLKQISYVVAFCHLVCLIAPSPVFFGLKSFNSFLKDIDDISFIFEQSEYINWNSFRNSITSRYIALVLPNMLLRSPYGSTITTTENINYNENIKENEHEKFLWGNSVYALCACIARSFARTRWFANIKGIERGGGVSNLPQHSFTTDFENIAVKYSSEIELSNDISQSLTNLGFIPLMYYKGLNVATFMDTNTAHKIEPKETSELTDSQLSIHLEYILIQNRVVCYLIKLYCESFCNTDEKLKKLNEWLKKYVAKNNPSENKAEAQFPFLEAKVELISDKQLRKKIMVSLKPHYRLIPPEKCIKTIAILNDY